MILHQVARFFVVAALLLPKATAQGEVFETAGKDKAGSRHMEKRRDNFRVPVEMPFDPKFWPARGRRSGPDADVVRLSPKGPVTCELGKDGPLCRDDGSYEAVVQPRMTPVRDLDSGESPDRIRPDSECPTLADANCTDFLTHIIRAVFLECVRLMQMAAESPDAFADPDIRRFQVNRLKKHGHVDFPMWMTGRNVFWRPDLSYGSGDKEMEKKQDVFWVTRGKRDLTS